jgi:hypothetical protein
LNEENIITNGLIVSTFSDEGPINIYNSSPLDEEEALNHSLKNFMVFSAEVPESYDEIHSLGPIPTPVKPYVSLAFIFILKPEETIDARVEEFGRITVFWVISKSTAIMKYELVLKQILRRVLRFYGIRLDTDLEKDNVIHKIDEKMKIIETGMDAYYISQDTLEPLANINLVPQNDPIILIDNPNKIIRVLLREVTSSIRKTKIRQTLSEYVRQLPQGTSYKTDFISEPVTIQMWLSKSGFETPKSTDTQFKIRFFDKLTFEELDEFVEDHLTPRRRELVKKILHAIDTNTVLPLYELASETGITAELIEQILKIAIDRRLIQNRKIESGIFKIDG